MRATLPTVGGSIPLISTIRRTGRDDTPSMSVSSSALAVRRSRHRACASLTAPSAHYAADEPTSRLKRSNLAATPLASTSASAERGAAPHLRRRSRLARRGRETSGVPADNPHARHRATSHRPDRSPPERHLRWRKSGTPRCPCQICIGSPGRLPRYRGHQPDRKSTKLHAPGRMSTGRTVRQAPLPFSRFAARL